MAILNEMILEEIGGLVKEEVRKEVNQIKLEDAKIIVQVLLPEIDKIVTSKINKLARRLATDVISWDLVNEKEEQIVVPVSSEFVEEGNASRVEVISREEKDS